MSYAEEYRLLRKEGICVRQCGALAVPGKAMCAPCAKKTADTMREKAQARQALGLCQHCDRPAEMVPAKMGVPAHVGQRCALHRKKNAKRCAKWGAINGKAKFDRLQAAGVCASNPKHGSAAPGSPYCQPCRDRFRNLKRNRQLVKNLKALL